jgi:hypothetical protein
MKQQRFRIQAGHLLRWDVLFGAPIKQARRRHGSTDGRSATGARQGLKAIRLQGRLFPVQIMTSADGWTTQGHKIIVPAVVTSKAYTAV